MKKKRGLAIGLVVLSIVSLIFLTGFMSFKRTCRVFHNYEASINVQQTDGGYAYTIVTNANIKGKWAVVASTLDRNGDEHTYTFTNPQTQLKKGQKVAHNVWVRLGLLSGADKRIAVDFVGGTCQSYPLSSYYQ